MSQLTILTSERYDTPEGMFHGFFTREGGVSEGIFSGLNCGLASGDELAKVKQNRALVAAAAGVAETHLCTAAQIHSGEALEVAAPLGTENLPQVDALVSRTPGIALGVLTADCAPVLMWDKQAGVIGAVHAGWKGAVAGVVGNTVTAMQNIGARYADITAIVGPCIGKASYQVGADLRDAVLAVHPEAAKFFAEDGENHWRFDLRNYVYRRLAEQGIGKIEMLPNDTYAEEAQFFSYRRTTQRGEAQYGRQISVIALR